MGQCIPPSPYPYPKGKKKKQNLLRKYHALYIFSFSFILRGAKEQEFQQILRNNVYMQLHSKKLFRNITKFNSQATSSSTDITIADEPASTSSDLSEDNFDATSKPAYFRSCILIGFLGGLGRDSPQTSSTRFKSCKYTSS